MVNPLAMPTPVTRIVRLLTGLRHFAWGYLDDPSIDANGRRRIASNANANDHGANITLTVASAKERTALDKPRRFMIGYNTVRQRKCVAHRRELFYNGLALC
jgi:hypothetical protein